MGIAERMLTSAMINLLRIVAIELGTWRSVLGGGASGSITFGNGKFFEPRGVTNPRGGNPLPLGDQKSVGGDAQRGVVVEAAPASSFEMSEPDLLFELLIIALDTPTEFSEVHQFAEGDVFRQGRKPIFGRLFLAFGHSIDGHFSGQLSVSA